MTIEIALAIAAGACLAVGTLGCIFRDRGSAYDYYTPSSILPPLSLAIAGGVVLVFLLIFAG